MESRPAPGHKDRMNGEYKPAGYNSVSPYPCVDGAARTIDFLVKAFRAIDIQRHMDEGGRVMHAEVRIDDTVVMLCDPIEGSPAMASHVHVYVPDVHAVYRKALEAGAASVQEPVKKQDAD